MIFLPQPVEGIAWWKRQEDDRLKHATWSPSRIEVSADGTYGYTVDPYVLTRAGQTTYGTNFAIWKKHGGDWKLAVYLSVPTGIAKRAMAQTSYPKRTVKVGESMASLEALRRAEKESPYLDDVVVLRRGQAPAVGEDANLLLKREPLSKPQTTRAMYAMSHDFAYTYGLGKLNSRTTNFVRVWRRVGNGSWVITAEVADFSGTR